jgi:hypothetical protein
MNFVAYGNNGGPRKMRSMFAEIIVDVLQIFGRRRRPANAHQD